MPRFFLVVCSLSVALTASLWLPVPARADLWRDNMGGLHHHPVAASISSGLSSYYWGEMMNEAWEKKRQSEGTPSAASTRAEQPPVTTTFTADQRRTLLDKAAPGQRERAKQILAMCDQIYAATMAQAASLTARKDLDDVATGGAFYIAIAHHLYWEGEPDAPTPAAGSHLPDLRIMMRNALASGGKLAKTSDLEKQAARDAFVVAACLPLIEHKQAKRAPDQTRRQSVRRAAGDLLTQIGLSATALQFKDDGSVGVVESQLPAQRNKKR